VIERQQLRPVENRKIEKGQVIAELVYLELQMRGTSRLTLQAATNHTVPLPRLLRVTLKECKSA
jgi:hypothetical protein